MLHELTTGERYILPKPSEDPKKTPQAGGATLEEVIEEEEEDVAETEEKDGAEEKRKDEEEHGEIGLGLSFLGFDVPGQKLIGGLLP